jgi:hypothetical protein
MDVAGTSCEHRLVPLTQADHSILKLLHPDHLSSQSFHPHQDCIDKGGVWCTVWQTGHQANIATNCRPGGGCPSSVVGPAVHLEVSPEQSNVIALQMLHGLVVDFCKV